MTDDDEKRPPILISLRLLKQVDVEGSYPDVLRTLGQAVRNASRRITDAESGGNFDAIEAVTDIENPNLELLLGTAYVVCQAWVTAVTQAALNVRQWAMRDGLNSCAFDFDKDYEVRDLGTPFENSRYSKITVLWELGNYFKHRDQWPRIWTDDASKDAGLRGTGLHGNLGIWTDTKLQGEYKAKYTIATIKAAGLCGANSHGNLGAGAKALGNADYSDMRVFETIIRDWHQEVYASCVEATAPLHRGYL